MMTQPKVRVRLARPEEDAELGEFMIQAFVETYARKMPEVVVSEARKEDLRAVAAKRASAAVLVAEGPGGEIVGTTTLFPAGTPGSKAWIEGATELRYFSVREDWRGQGVSDLLLSAACDQARAWGASAVCLHVRRGAHGVARFYERHGFRRELAGDVDRLPEIYLEGYFLSCVQQSGG